jgi:hypothetical protein
MSGHEWHQLELPVNSLLLQLVSCIVLRHLCCRSPRRCLPQAKKNRKHIEMKHALVATAASLRGRSSKGPGAGKKV